MPVSKQDYSHQYRQHSSNGVQVMFIRPQILLFDRHACQLLEYADFQSSVGNSFPYTENFSGHCITLKLIELGFLSPENNL